MIFPPDSVIQRRQALKARVDAGSLTGIETLQEALRADPDNALALLALGYKYKEAGNPAEAERCARAYIRIQPSSYNGYLLLGRAVGHPEPLSHLSRGYLALALRKMQFDEETLDQLGPDNLAKIANFGDLFEGLSTGEVFKVVIDFLQKDQHDEPAEVEEELRPHRLIHELSERREGVLDRDSVAGILETAPVCEPMLLGILKEFGADHLTEDDYRTVERALVLLGEIGNPAHLPAITEFLSLADEELSGPADWAFRRISFQHPLETLDKIREMLPSSRAPERVVLGQQIAMMPHVPGRSALLTSLTQGIEGFRKTERDAVIFSAIAGFYLVEGGRSFHAAALERKHASTFSPEAHADLRALHKETASLTPEDAVPDALSVYDICCTEPGSSDDDDDDDHDGRIQPIVHRSPKPGRNEPCWCGSGKKYKKCHLDQDQRE